MHTLSLSTNLSPCPQNPNPSFPNPNPSRNFSSKTQNVSPISTQKSLNPKLSSFSLDEWPQLIQISIESTNLDLGTSIHANLAKLGYQNEAFMGNNLVNMYSKFGKTEDAQKVFDEMLVRDSVSWTSLMNGYSVAGDKLNVFRVVNEMMEEEGIVFNEHTVSVMLRTCEKTGDLRLGEQVHCFAMKIGVSENVVVGTSLISMYCKCWSVGDADCVFCELPYVDVQCRNLMILEYGKMGDGFKAIDCFMRLISCGLEPNGYTFTNAISACDENFLFEEGRQLHGLAVKSGVIGITSVANAVITMYANRGLVEDSEAMFRGMGARSLISWTALLSGYVKNGHFEKAFSVFVEMLEIGISLDSSCWATVLDCCSEPSNYEMGLQLHGLLIKLGVILDVHVGTALVDFYAKNGNVKSSKSAFHGILNKTMASLNAALAGFLKIDCDEDPMDFFQQQRSYGLLPDAITFSRLLSLTASHALLMRGKSLHAYAIKTGHDSDLAVSNALVTMYAKCGVMEDAYRMFNGMVNRDVISWNSIISALSISAQGNEALLVFEEMKRQGCSPDCFTLLALLQGCGYHGLVEVGIRLFEEMDSKYGIRPTIEHFVSAVDLLGRGGLLLEATEFISKSPYSDSPMLWRSLVHVCMQLRGDSRVGEIASKRLLELEPRDAGSYMLVSNMYAGEGRFLEAAKVRGTMNDLKISKEAGCSWIEIDRKVHQFTAQCGFCPEILDSLTEAMRRKSDPRVDLELV